METILENKVAEVTSTSPPTTTTTRSEPARTSNTSTGVFSPLAQPFRSRRGNDLLNMMSSSEPRAADPAPEMPEVEDMMLNYRIGEASTGIFDDPHPLSSYHNVSSTADAAASSAWSQAEAAETPRDRNAEMSETIAFLVNCITSANSFVTLLNRDHASIIRSIRPRVLYDFLMEVSRVRLEKRIQRRSMPNECAFCKNNGENEECYSSHALKDWSGRVLCPVLRAFRCPRCGATGDRAHTIKYCPEADAVSERSGLTSRRRSTPATSMSTSLFLDSITSNVQMSQIGQVGQTASLGRNSYPPTTGTTTPLPSSTASNQYFSSSLWSSMGLN